jgi:hypothetical protein
VLDDEKLELRKFSEILVLPPAFSIKVRKQAEFCVAKQEERESGGMYSIVRKMLNLQFKAM